MNKPANDISTLLDLLACVFVVVLLPVQVVGLGVLETQVNSLSILSVQLQRDHKEAALRQGLAFNCQRTSG